MSVWKQSELFPDFVRTRYTLMWDPYQHIFCDDIYELGTVPEEHLALVNDGYEFRHFYLSVKELKKMIRKYNPSY